MQQGARDILSGGVLLALGIALYLAIPGQVETYDGDTLTPASVPQAITAFICVLAAILVVQGIRALPADSGRFALPDAGPLATMAATVAVMFVYAGILTWAGYIAATAVALILFAVLFGNRNWVQILILAAVAPPALMLFFRYTMLVLLPQGEIFN